MTKQLFLVVIFAFVVSPGVSWGTDWLQFRGAGGRGVAETNDPLPAEIGPDQHLVWKSAIPPGHSSPVLVGDRIYLTAVRNQQLLTLALDRNTGQVIWEVEAPYAKLESIHTIGSHAQPTAVTDGDRVVVIFGSSGMYCYDKNGQQQWHVPFGPFNNDFGAGTSPIMVEDRILVCQDHDTDSFLAVYDKHSGNLIWKTDRAEFPRNYCSPVIWTVDGRRQIVISATLRTVGYDYDDGRELWTVRGLSRSVCNTPIVGDDNRLYVAAWSAGGDAESRISAEPFEQAVKSFDANSNGKLEESEIPPEHPFRPRFSQIDRDNSQAIEDQEYNYYRNLFDTARNVVMAIKPGAKGEATDTHVAWEHDKSVPFCTSLLNYRGKIFTIKDGGIMQCIDAISGQAEKRLRIPGTANYYASPVAGDGKIYLIDEAGELSVVEASSECTVLHSVKFGEPAYATPAIADGKIYVRTNGGLYCFGEGAKK